MFESHHVLLRLRSLVIRVYDVQCCGPIFISLNILSPPWGEIRCVGSVEGRECCKSQGHG